MSKVSGHGADVSAERGNRVILMDFLGHSESDKLTDEIADFLDEVWAR